VRYGVRFVLIRVTRAAPVCPWQVNILLVRAKLDTGPQWKEMDEINPESARTDVPPVANMAPVAYMALVASASAERGAAADREHRAC
jgi:NAD/NADP transhydrogenase beta subunit